MTTPRLAPAPRTAQKRSGCSLAAGATHRAVRGDDLDLEQVVDGPAEAAGEVAEPAAERQPGDADLGDEAERRGEAVELGLTVDVAEQAARAAPSRCAPRGRRRRRAAPTCRASARRRPARCRRCCGRRRAPRPRRPCSRANVDRGHDVGGAGRPHDERRRLRRSARSRRWSRRRSPGRRAQSTGPRNRGRSSAIGLVSVSGPAAIFDLPAHRCGQRRATLRRPRALGIARINQPAGGERGHF